VATPSHISFNAMKAPGAYRNAGIILCDDDEVAERAMMSRAIPAFDREY